MNPAGRASLHENLQAARRAAALDSGTLAERLAASAHHVAYHADASTRELRELAALARELAARHDRGHGDAP
jgi:hypothetical protein